MRYIRHCCFDLEEVKGYRMIDKTEEGSGYYYDEHKETFEDIDLNKFKEEVERLMRWSCHYVEMRICQDFGMWRGVRQKEHETEILRDDGYMPEGYHRIRRFLLEEELDGDG